MTQDVRIRELTEENELLFKQLHVVQEELEKYHYKLKTYEQRVGTDIGFGEWNSRFLEVLAENQKLQALAELWQQVSQVEKQNSLPSRLGDILIKGVGSTGAFLSLPGKLRKMWKALEQTTSPAALGGQSFQEVIDAYNADGMNAVEELLDSVFISPAMRANAYTALARHLMPSDVKKTAEIARLAYETDPRPFRLKWLAFRMHDADDVVTADAMLEILPADIAMTDSEQRKAMRIHNESTQLRKKNAAKDAVVRDYKNAENKKIAQLTKQVEEYRHEEERLHQRQDELQKLADTRQADLKKLQVRLAEQESLTVRFKEENDALQVRLKVTQLAAKQVEEHRSEEGRLRQQQEELQKLAGTRQVDLKKLQVRLAEQEVLTVKRKEENDVLQVRLKELTEENELLLKQLHVTQEELTEQESLTKIRIKEIGTLQVLQTDLHAQADNHKMETEALLVRLTEQEALAVSREEEVDALKAAQDEIQSLADSYKAEANALQKRLTEQESLIESQVEEITALKVLRTDLQSLADSHKMEAEELWIWLAEQEALAADRGKEVDSLKAAQDEIQSLADSYKAEANALQVRLAEQESLLDNYNHKTKTEDLQVQLAEQKFLTESYEDIDMLKALKACLHVQAENRKMKVEDLRIRLTEREENNAMSLRLGEIEKIDALKALRPYLHDLIDSHETEVDAVRLWLTEQEALANERKMEVDRLNVQVDQMCKLYQEEVRLVTAQQEKIISAIMSHESVLTSCFEKQKSELERIHKSLKSSSKQEIDKAFQQSVAYDGLSEYFKSGKLPEVVPWERGWPASPDFILWMVELIDRNDYDLILEFGSGITTLYTAKTLVTREKKNASEKKTSSVTFDHLEQYALQTRDILSQAGFGQRVNVIHAPLQEYTAPDGTAYQYYSCQDSLAELSSQYKSTDTHMLVIVDGPPGGTNKNARYPAFPLVMKYFAPAHIDFLLDDYIRREEKELAKMWQAACATAGIEYAVIEKKLEKEALLLRIAASSMPDPNPDGSGCSSFAVNAHA
ncbi:hypothetical protein LJC71_10680 [Desulfosarcina sp. OttesenSCG-928-A07]|nr:hypothetical protein [Desulfosarcina sp. OttesenSCG-928-G17]MDL2330185.1 hypothetical protein [Desulfosarcina sp. OttesenSCG-928-A07]